jgi:hypothetical protein
VNIIINAKKLKYKSNRDNALGLYICLYLLLNAFNSTLQSAFGVSGGTLSAIKLLIQMVLILLLVNAVNHMKIRAFNVLFVMEFFGVLSIMYGYLQGVEISELLSWSRTLLPVCIPIAFCAMVIKEKQVLYDMLLKTSWLIFIVLTIHIFAGKDQTYSMHFSYAMLVVMLLHLNEWLARKKTIYFVIAVVEFLMILLFGSRGALVCVAVFLILKIISTEGSLRKKIPLIVVICIGTVGLFFIFDYFRPLILQYLSSRGKLSRTLKLLLIGEFSSYDSGRIDLWNRVIELIQERPILGWGIGGAVNQMGYPYPHQLFLDLLLTFGIPLGVLLITLIFYQVIRAVIRQNGVHKDLIQIFGSTAMVCLMFSGTVFTNFYFFLFMGLCLSVKWNKKRVNIGDAV